MQKNEMAKNTVWMAGSIPFVDFTRHTEIDNNKNMENAIYSRRFEWRRMCISFAEVRDVKYVHCARLRITRRSSCRLHYAIHFNSIHLHAPQPSTCAARAGNTILLITIMSKNYNNKS